MESATWELPFSGSGAWHTLETCTSQQETAEPWRTCKHLHRAAAVHSWPRPRQAVMPATTAVAVPMPAGRRCDSVGHQSEQEAHATEEGG